jgi:hypothetical protein
MQESSWGYRDGNQQMAGCITGRMSRYENMQMAIAGRQIKGGIKGWHLANEQMKLRRDKVNG